MFARRYFYPLLTDFAPYEYAKGSCPVAEDAARRVLTLPTYYGLSAADAKAINEAKAAEREAAYIEDAAKV